MTGVVTYLVFIWASCALVTSSPAGNSTYQNAPRTGFQSGLLYVTSAGRLKMPPATRFVLTPTLSVPMSDDLPDPYTASATISVPFVFDFDLLGLTDVQNSFGLLKRVTRQATDAKERHAGGDRAPVYRVAENAIQSAGLDGRACLLRAICEINLDYAAQHLGLFGEVLHLFLSPSKSARDLGEYTAAEKQARTAKDCSQYQADCPYSFFFDQGKTTTNTTHV